MSTLFQKNTNSADLGKQVFRGGLVSTVSRALQSVLQVVSTIVLARLLSPEDFGLMAIIFAITSFAPMLIDCGLGDVTVQRQTISHEQVSALFWINLAVGCLFALLLLFGSQTIARIYAQPALAEMTAVFGLTFVFSALAMQHLALLRRSMRFGDIAVIETSAFIIAAGVAISMAVKGFGYWSLVVRPVLSAFLTASGAWILSRWRPGLRINSPGLRSNLKFGAGITFGSVVHIVSNTLDRAWLGFSFAPRILGFYQYGFLLYENAFSAIISPLNAVGLAALSKLQGDRDLLRQKYLAASAFVSFYAMPAFAILIVVGPDLTPFILGEKWEPAGILLSIFAIRGIVHFFEISQLWFHLALGNTKRFIRWAFLTCGVQVIALGVGIPFGIHAVALSIVLARSALAIPSILYAGRSVGLTFKLLSLAIWKPFVGALISIGAAVVALSILPEGTGRFIRILVPSIVGMAVYMWFVTKVLKLVEPLDRPLRALRKIMPKRLHSLLPFSTHGA